MRESKQACAVEHELWGARPAEPREQRLARVQSHSQFSVPVKEGDCFVYASSCSMSPLAPVTITVMYLGFVYTEPSAETDAVSTVPVAASYGM